jgi:hypothetical protein
MCEVIQLAYDTAGRAGQPHDDAATLLRDSQSK